MNLSEVIKQLEDLREKHGELEVVSFSNHEVTDPNFRVYKFERYSAVKGFEWRRTLRIEPGEKK